VPNSTKEVQPRKTPIEVRQVTALSGADLCETASLLTAAFDASPLFQLAFPNAEKRQRLLHILFTAVLEDALRFGHVEIAYRGRMAGILVWYQPGLYPISLLRTLRLLPHYLRVAVRAPRGVMRLFRAQTLLNRLRPSSPHCHGYFLGGRSGEQIGAILARRVLAVADEAGHPFYLETQERRSVKLYLRLGFRTLGNGVEALPGGPLTWTMWREPRARGGKTANVRTCGRARCDGAAGIPRS
jgi:hypothetical protein